jgi:hypothetical protein
MASTPAQQRRYQAALRRVIARFRREQPKKYKQWLGEALADIDREAE